LTGTKNGGAYKEHSTWVYYTGEFDSLYMKGRGQLDWESNNGFKYSYYGIFNEESKPNCWGLIEGSYVIEGLGLSKEFKVRNGVSAGSAWKTWVTKEGKNGEFKKEQNYKEDASKNEKYKKKSFEIVYSIKMKQEESIDFGIVGRLFGTPKAITAKKGGHYERSLIMRDIYDMPTKAEALHFIRTNDSDVKKGKAGSSTIHIIKIELY
jgi:hypothetical protein